jgi:predicted transcriptional regulator
VLLLRGEVVASRGAAANVETQFRVSVANLIIPDVQPPRWLEIEERELRRMTLRVPAEVHEALKTLGQALGISLNQMACQALHEYLQRNGRWEAVEEWLLRTGERYRADVEAIRAELGYGQPWPAARKAAAADPGSSS